MAVSDILQTSPELVAAALAADNVVIAVYFAFLFSLCRPSSEEEIAATAMIPKAPSGNPLHCKSCYGTCYMRCFTIVHATNNAGPSIVDNLMH